MPKQKAGARADGHWSATNRLEKVKRGSDPQTRTCLKLEGRARGERHWHREAALLGNPDEVQEERKHKSERLVVHVKGSGCVRRCLGDKAFRTIDTPCACK